MSDISEVIKSIERKGESIYDQKNYEFLKSKGLKFFTITVYYYGAQHKKDPVKNKDYKMFKFSSDKSISASSILNIMKQKNNTLLVLDEPLSSDNIFYGDKLLPQIDEAKYHIADGGEAEMLCLKMHLDPIDKCIENYSNKILGSIRYMKNSLISLVEHMKY